MQQNLILVVDDDSAMRESITDYFTKAGFKIKSYASGMALLEELDLIFEPKVIVCDLKMPKMNGLEVLQKVVQKPTPPPLIIMTAHGDVPTAVKAIQKGAFDFIEKPFNPEHLSKMILQAIKTHSLEQDNLRLRRRLDEVSKLDKLLLGNSEAIQKLRQQIVSVADNSDNVLLIGEPGVDKEIVARAIHQHSSQEQHPFVGVNCQLLTAALLEKIFTNVFTKAGNGVVFLEHPDEISFELQRQFLSLLERKPQKTRLISAITGKPQQDDFLKALYDNTGKFILRIPPLCERGDDVLALFNLYLTQFASQHQQDIPALSADDISALVNYSWPQNQRQLKQIAERFILSSRNKSVTIAHLLELAPGGVDIINRGNKNLRILVQDFERQLLIQALLECSGNISLVCDLLKVPRRTLNEKLLKHQLSRSMFVD